MTSACKKFFRLTVTVIYIFCSLKTNAQNDSLFRFLKEIDYPTSSFTADDLGELYIINTDNQLKKYNEKGDSLGVFNQVTKYGKLSYVEAQNPWKVILFYKNYSTIVLLDKFLNVLGNINLRRHNIFQVQAVTTSYDNNIWLYDEQENKLKKIDEQGGKLFESVDFRLLFDSVPTPKKIIDTDGFVYLYDPEKGLYIFDYYGTFKNKFPFLHWTNVAVIDKKIYGFDNDYIYEYSASFPDVKRYKLSPELQNASSIEAKNHRLYVLKNQKLEIYTLH